MIKFLLGISVLVWLFSTTEIFVDSNGNTHYASDVKVPTADELIAQMHKEMAEANVTITKPEKKVIHANY